MANNGEWMCEIRDDLPFFNNATRSEYEQKGSGHAWRMVSDASFVDHIMPRCEIKGCDGVAEWEQSTLEHINCLYARMMCRDHAEEITDGASVTVWMVVWDYSGERQIAEAQLPNGEVNW